MLQTVRLYKLHDYDLIYMQKILCFPVKVAMKQALAAYVRNEPLFFKIPVMNVNEKEELSVKIVQFHINLDESEDLDLIKYLKGLKKNYRNSFLKNLLRGYLAGPATYVYENEIDFDKTQEVYKQVEENVLSLKTLQPLKQRKKYKKHIILTEDQKKLFDMTGALDDVEVIISDRNKNSV